MAVTRLLLCRDGAVSTDFGRVHTGVGARAGAADQRCVRSVGLSTAISGCCCSTSPHQDRLMYLAEVVHGSTAHLLGCGLLFSSWSANCGTVFSLMRSISSNPVESGTLFYWSSDVAWDPLTVFTQLRCRGTSADFLKAHSLDKVYDVFCHLVLALPFPIQN